MLALWKPKLCARAAGARGDGGCSAPSKSGRRTGFMEREESGEEGDRQERIVKKRKRAGAGVFRGERSGRALRRRTNGGGSADESDGPADDESDEEEGWSSDWAGGDESSEEEGSGSGGPGGWQWWDGSRFKPICICVCSVSFAVLVLFVLFCLLKLTCQCLFGLLAIQLHASHGPRRGQVVGLRDVGVVRGFRGAGVVPVWPIVGRLLPQKSRLPPVREALRHPPQEAGQDLAP